MRTSREDASIITHAARSIKLFPRDSIAMSGALNLDERKEVVAHGDGRGQQETRRAECGLRREVAERGTPSSS